MTPLQFTEGLERFNETIEDQFLPHSQSMKIVAIF